MLHATLSQEPAVLSRADVDRSLHDDAVLVLDGLTGDADSLPDEDIRLTITHH